MAFRNKADKLYKNIKNLSILLESEDKNHNTQKKKIDSDLFLFFLRNVF